MKGPGIQSDRFVKDTRRRRPYLLIAGVAGLFGLYVALFVAYAAFYHNPNGEFCSYISKEEEGHFVSNGDPCEITWRLIELTFIAFVEATLFLLVLAFIAVGITSIIRKFWPTPGSSHD